MRCEGLSSEHRTVVWHGCFKAFGVDAPIWELAVCFALRFAADAGDVAEEVPEPAAEDVAFVCRHLQRFLDGVGESVACEAEVLEHNYVTNLLVTIILRQTYCKPVL